MISAPGRGGTLSMGRFSPAVIALIVVLVVGIVPPFFFLGYSSLHLLDARGGFGAFTLGNFAAIFTGRALAPMLINSVLYPLGAAVLALVLGAAQAWLAERTDASLRQLLYVTAIISLGIPYVLYIVAWLLFLGRAGPFNALL